MSAQVPEISAPAQTFDANQRWGLRIVCDPENPKFRVFRTPMNTNYTANGKRKLDPTEQCPLIRHIQRVRHKCEWLIVPKT